MVAVQLLSLVRTLDAQRITTVLINDGTARVEVEVIHCCSIVAGGDRSTPLLYLVFASTLQGCILDAFCCTRTIYSSCALALEFCA